MLSPTSTSAALPLTYSPKKTIDVEMRLHLAFWLLFDACRAIEMKPITCDVIAADCACLLPAVYSSRLTSPGSRLRICPNEVIINNLDILRRHRMGSSEKPSLHLHGLAQCYRRDVDYFKNKSIIMNLDPNVTESNAPFRWGYEHRLCHQCHPICAVMIRQQ